MANVPQWQPLDAVLRSGEDSRSPELLREVIAQFDVAFAPRYQPVTFCNVFVWDFTRAMGCEVPHWVKLDGTPATPGQGSELSVNGIVEWLRRHGPEQGWSEVDAAAAKDAANAGRPTLAAWLNSYGHGHIAVVVASPNGLRIAQAGMRCFADEPIEHGFGQLTPIFFTHA